MFSFVDHAFGISSLFECYLWRLQLPSNSDGTNVSSLPLLLYAPVILLFLSTSTMWKESSGWLLLPVTKLIKVEEES